MACCSLLLHSQITLKTQRPAEWRKRTLQNSKHLSTAATMLRSHVQCGRLLCLKRQNMQTSNTRGKKERQSTGDSIYATCITKPTVLRARTWEKEKHKNKKLPSCLSERWQEARHYGLNEYISWCFEKWRKTRTSTGCGEKKTMNFSLTIDRPLKGQQSQRNGLHKQALQRLSVNVVSAKARVPSNWDMRWCES